MILFAYFNATSDFILKLTLFKNLVVGCSSVKVQLSLKCVRNFKYESNYILATAVLVICIRNNTFR